MLTKLNRPILIYLIKLDVYINVNYTGLFLQVIKEYIRLGKQLRVHLRSSRCQMATPCGLCAACALLPDLF